MLILAVALAAATPEAEALGRRLAESGMLSALLPTLEAKETAELIAAHPEMSAAEQAELRTDAAAVAAAGKARAYAAMARAYAARLSVADLRALLAWNATPAARRYRAAQPEAIAAATQAMAGLDLKTQALATFCARTGRGCAR